jgi:hypothetical protein
MARERSSVEGGAAFRPGVLESSLLCIEHGQESSRLQLGGQSGPDIDYVGADGFRHILIRGEMLFHYGQPPQVDP